jgi:alcohol dehydrogenase (cytochrome c)
MRRCTATKNLSSPPCREGLPTGRRSASPPAIAALALFFVASPAQAQSAPAFTAAQDAAGEALYAQHCAACHGAGLEGGQFGPALAGAIFERRWGGAPLDELFGYMRSSMPPAAVGQLPDADYLALLAHQMARNGASSGADALPADPERLAAMAVPGEALSSQAALRANPFLGLTPGAVWPAWPARPNPLDAVTPVTDALLADPPPGEWLAWRRGHDGQGFSPLTEITAENVGGLQLAWSLTLPPGPNTVAPLMHDGVLYVFGYGDRVFALDAETGDELWRYERRLPEGQGLNPKRTMALWGDKLYVATSDTHLIALDVRTGRVAWDRSVGEGGFRITGGPMAANGVVMQGVVGQMPGGAHIAGLDAETGEELWRFQTVAQPGEPGGDTWNGLPLDARKGGSVWTSGTYDPELDLAFFGPAPTYDTGPMRFPSEEPGVTNDGLYTDTTVALRPRTGELVWHYQHMRNDQWDMDWAFERVVLEAEIDGAPQKVLVSSGKEGWFDVLDAETGAYLRSFDMGIQNFILAADPETGVKTIDQSLIPGGLDHAITVCPFGGGGRNWMPTAYDAATGSLYVVAVDACMAMTPLPPGETGFLTTNVTLTISPPPDGDGRYGLLQAIDVASGAIRWEARRRAPPTTGVLATAGGVVFMGALDRRFAAYDGADGEELWSAGLPDVPNGTPISYAVDGKQYVAMVVGYGSPSTNTWPGVVPEVTLPSVRSSAVFVFALPAD